MRGVLAIFRRELVLAWAGGSGLFLPAAFFAGTIFLAPLGVGTEPRLLSALGPGLIFVALCLASLTTLERIFQADLETGALDHQRLAGLSMELVTLVKVAAHWLVSGLPIALLTPIAAVMMRAETVSARTFPPIRSLPDRRSAWRLHVRSSRRGSYGFWMSQPLRSMCTVRRSYAI